MGQTDMKALGEAIAVLDAQEDGGATLLTEDARRYYGQVVSLVTVRGLYEELAHAQAHGYAPPGKVLVSIETLSELTWCAAGGKHCAGEKCKAFAHCDQKMVAAYPEQTCRDAWLAHLGLGEEGGDK